MWDAWRAWWYGRPDDVIDRLIRPPVVKYTGTDEGLAVKAAQRRTAADSIRRRAVAAAAGESVRKLLTMAKR